jgi:hypothetical protein
MNPEKHEGETPNNTLETQNKLIFHFKDLDLSEKNPKSEEVEFVVEKQPIPPIENGKSYPNSHLIIDSEGSKIPELVNTVRELRVLPEEERIHKVLELVRDNVKFPYPEILKKVRENNPSLAEWVEENIHPKSKVVNLSELLDKGYGVCKHLSLLYLYLAQEAGLEGMYCSSGSDITNILRSDNGEPLFKMTKVGEKAPPHAWVEIRTSSGKWIPVDPTTNLVGDTQEGVDMFKKANYMAEVYGLKKEVNPPNSFSYVLHGSFLPDQNTALMRLTTIVKKTISLREEDKYSPYKGDVEVTISNDLTDPMSNSTIKTV